MIGIDSTTLILQGQEIILELTALYLKRYGHKTITCSSVEVAVEHFKKNNGNVDFLVADISLPDGSGVKAGFQFWESTPSLKILFMSGNGVDEWRREDAEYLKRLPQESVRILQKPCSGSDLAECLGHWLGAERPEMKPASRAVAPDDEAAHQKIIMAALERQADLLELAHDAIIVRNLDGIIRFWNRGAESLYGWNRDVAVGRLAHDILRTIFPVPFIDIQKAIETVGHWEGELHHTTRDGALVIVSSRWAVRQATDGSCEILEINRDITAQKKVEDSFRRIHRELVLRADELARSEERFRNLLESAPDAMVISNTDGEIALINGQTETLFGYSRDELVGRNIELLIPERFRNGHAKHALGFAGDPQCRRMGRSPQLLGLRKNGEEFPVQITLSPLSTEDGLLVSSAIRDVSASYNTFTASR